MPPQRGWVRVAHRLPPDEKMVWSVCSRAPQPVGFLRRPLFASCLGTTPVRVVLGCAHPVRRWADRSAPRPTPEPGFLRPGQMLRNQIIWRAEGRCGPTAPGSVKDPLAPSSTVRRFGVCAFDAPNATVGRRLRKTPRARWEPASWSDASESDHLPCRRPMWARQLREASEIHWQQASRSDDSGSERSMLVYSYRRVYSYRQFMLTGGL